MDLLDIVYRSENPLPWSEGDNIPWNEPGFSGRMLREHLTQSHNAASRRFEIIDQHIAWIHNDILNRRPTKILDIGCGPGLYSNRLSKLGHICSGIDYSPASIRYARDQAKQDNLAITYLEQDIRTADFGQGFNLVMLIFGEFNIFKPDDAGLILDKIFNALEIGGILLLEIHTYKVIEQMGNQARHGIPKSGLFSDQPYICLQESHWDNEHWVVNRRYHH
jgi:SAM-dependent methyltransferase